MCEKWLLDLFFSQFCKSDMSRYGYFEIFQSLLDFKTTRVDCPVFSRHMKLLDLKENI